jgi:HSP20 family protein
MANLPRLWSSSFGDIDTLRRSFDEMFDQMLGERPVLRSPGADRMPAIESYLENGTFVVRADLPGIDPKDVEITVSGNLLQIRGHRESTRESTDRDYYHHEVHYGAFERSIQLPEGVSATDVKASYKSGVLELRAPLPTQSRPHKVAVTIEPAKPDKT